MDGEEGLEPSSLASEASILPLNYSPVKVSPGFANPRFRTENPVSLPLDDGDMVPRTGLEPAPTWVKTREPSNSLPRRGAPEETRTPSPAFGEPGPIHRRGRVLLVLPIPPSAATPHNLWAAVPSLVPPAGFEPAHPWVETRCSHSTELRRRGGRDGIRTRKPVSPQGTRPKHPRNESNVRSRVRSPGPGSAGGGMELLGRIELPSLPYQGNALPLSYKSMEPPVGFEPTTG